MIQKCFYFTADDTSQEKISWLQNAVDPWHMVELYWQVTVDIRLKPVKEGKGNIADYLKQFPALKQPKGYTLVSDLICNRDKNEGCYKFDVSVYMCR